MEVNRAITLDRFLASQNKTELYINQKLMYTFH